VSFEYALSTRQAIKDVNLHIKPGEVIALVGENGSGKTTLIKLLCRLYDPTSGSISIDGTDIRQFKADELRREISVIFQDYVQYDLTARENIWVGNMDLPLDDERITQAAKRSGADSVIQTLPLGYDTTLGRVFDNSEELSIGQWQKVAIARAFLRESQVIILDEPTSALDPQAEYEVFEKFRQLIKDQAAVLISHRLSTVKMADRICVMQDGRIAEIGTHSELMSQGGVYSHLFDIQAKPTSKCSPSEYSH
jgi:ATP-binding cassette subfamily B protein